MDVVEQDGLGGGAIRGVLDVADGELEFRPRGDDSLQESLQFFDLAHRIFLTGSSEGDEDDGPWTSGDGPCSLRCVGEAGGEAAEVGPKDRGPSFRGRDGELDGGEYDPVDTGDGNLLDDGCVLQVLGESLLVHRVWGSGLFLGGFLLLEGGLVVVVDSVFGGGFKLGGEGVLVGMCIY